MLFSKSTGLAIALAFAGAQNSAAKPPLKERQDNIDPSIIEQLNNCPPGDMGVPDCGTLTPPVLDKKQVIPCTIGTNIGCEEGWLCREGDMGFNFCQPPTKRDTINARQEVSRCESSSDCADGEVCLNHPALGSYCTSFDTTSLPRRRDEIDARQTCFIPCPEGFSCTGGDFGMYSCTPDALKERRQLDGCSTGSCPEGQFCYTTIGASSCLYSGSLERRQIGATCDATTSSGCPEGWLCTQGDMGMYSCEPPVLRERQALGQCGSDVDCPEGTHCGPAPMMGLMCISD